MSCLVIPNVQESSQGPAGWYHGHQNPLKICKNLSLAGPQRFLCYAPQCPKISPGSPKTPKWTHQSCQMTRLRPKNTKIRLQHCQEYAILKQWAMIGGWRQREGVAHKINKCKELKKCSKNRPSVLTFTILGGAEYSKSELRSLLLGSMEKDSSGMVTFLASRVPSGVTWSIWGTSTLFAFILLLAR